MGEDLIMQLGQETLKTTVLVAAPLLVGALVTGLAVSVFQAVTQINEATLTFIPKIVIVAILMMIAGPWMLDTLTSFTSNLLENMSMFVRQ